MKKEKKHHNKKTVIMLIIILVAICLAVPIATGAWNPFKSRKLSKDAQTAYKNATQDSIDFATSVDIGIHEAWFNSSDYGPKGGYPYGFKVTEYGEGNVSGILLKKSSVDEGYYDTYGGFITIYYMKNFDYAKENYISMTNSLKSGAIYAKETVINDKLKIYYIIDKDHFPYFYILNNTIVYDLTINEMDNVRYAQNLFDYLKIDYTVPQDAQ